MTNCIIIESKEKFYEFNKFLINSGINSTIYKTVISDSNKSNTTITITDNVLNSQKVIEKMGYGYLTFMDMDKNIITKKVISIKDRYWGKTDKAKEYFILTTDNEIINVFTLISLFYIFEED